MKINGQEVDMKQVVAQYEQENRINYSKMKKKGNNVEWWNSTQGMAQREVFRQALMARIDTCHRQKIKYILTIFFDKVRNKKDINKSYLFYYIFLS